MYGYSRQDAVGQVSSTLLKTRNPTGHDIAYEQVTRDGSWEGRLVQTRRDGSELYVDARWVLDTEAGIILEVNREVTEHVKLAERFEVLVGSVSEYAIFLLDTEGTVVSWNPGAKRISRATRSTRSSAATSPSSTGRRRKPKGYRRSTWPSPLRRVRWSTKAGASARMEQSSGRRWSSPP